jgi:predicted phosphodiesterase
MKKSLTFTMSPARTLVFRLVLLGAIAFAGSRALAPAVFRLSSGDLTVRMTPAVPGGKLLLRLGPLGELSWNTHRSPVNVETSFLPARGADELPQAADLRDLRVSFLLRKLPWIALVGALAALLVVQALGRMWWRPALNGSGVAIALTGLIVGTSILTFNPAALRDPSYRGPVEDAPRILALLREVRGDWPGVQQNIRNLAIGLQRIHTQMTVPHTGPANGEPSLRLLVVSDVHNNPIGLMMARELATRFDVDGVLDAGDFTDRGTKLEGEVFARFAALNVPHVIVGGNHEDAAALARASSVEGVTVIGLEPDVARVAGVVVLGASDPNAAVIDDNPNNARARSDMPRLCEALAKRLVPTGAQILMVHDPRMGECAAKAAEEQGRPLVFVWGHTHKQAYEVHGSVTGLSPGTSGANGFKSAKDTPYGFSLLELDPLTKSLTSVCNFLLDSPSRVRQATCHSTPPQTANAAGAAG